MSAAAAAKGRRRHKGGHDEEEHENEERWLVSFADMMTLLMCLFMVLFSISSVNTSKLEALQRSLQEAFSGAVLSGGKAIMDSGAGDKAEKASVEPPVPAISPLEELQGKEGSQGSRAGEAKAAAQEQADFNQLKRRIDALAAKQGLSDKIDAQVRKRGLVVRLLTDGLFFDSGSADLKGGSREVLDKLGTVIGAERRHPVVVEGYTDSQPVNGHYPSNWELSGARAGSVVRALAGTGVATHRMSLAGYAQQHPVDTNTTAEGRARNRRVEIVLSRLNPVPEGSTHP